MRAEIGDQLVRYGLGDGSEEIVGVVTEVPSDDAGPPYVILWYDDGRKTKVCPNLARYRVRQRGNQGLGPAR